MSKTPRDHVVIKGVATAVIPMMKSLFRLRWSGQENLPEGTGVIVVSNHLTIADPFIIGHFLYAKGYMPHYMAKQSMFSWPVLGPIMTKSNQVPVARGSADAGASIAAAQKLVDSGEALIVYPEGTLTKDPAHWPMRAYTGAARLALATGAPVVPIAHWGDQELFPTGTTKAKANFRPVVQVSAVPAVDLDDLRGVPVTREVLATATNRIMDALVGELGRLRGEVPPAERFDPRKKTA